MKYLLDTNVISEIRKPEGDKGVKSFIGKLNEDDIYLSVITIGEICRGVDKLPASQKKHELALWLYQKLPERFGDKIVPLSTDIMIEWGRLQTHTQALPLFDSLIAASAIAYRMTVVTRNTKDFERIEGILLINPWEY